VVNISFALIVAIVLIGAVVAFYLIQHHNARAVLFVTVFTFAVMVLPLTISFIEFHHNEKPRIKPLGLLDTTQYVSWQTPDKEILWAALFGVLAIVIIAVLLEVLVVATNEKPIKGKLLKLPRNFHDHPSQSSLVKITVLIPAHNEEMSLPHTLNSLTSQTRPPERIIVVADNCTDGTVKIAESMGFEAYETVNNSHRKGGALNQILEIILPSMTHKDVILVMDADSQINDTFLESAAQYFKNFPKLDAVGGVFYGEDGHGVIGQFQRNEYTRYSDQIRRRRGRVFVLTGTASLFRASALSAVAKSRGLYIPGEPGRVYDTAALTEDNELTIALKTLGCPMVSPPECRVTTELMPTWKNLWVQRLRWQRGAVENLAAYGFTKTTLRYWGQQIGIAYGTIALVSALAVSFFMILAQEHWVWYPFWIASGLFFTFERVYTVKKGGFRAILLAIAVIPEILFDLFLQAAFIKVLIDTAKKSKASWGHVAHEVPKLERVT
jgi:cellulose synthase/poly-beta-1,6-N-acetylglucosamine synthase-like glycosyltransferase